MVRFIFKSLRLSLRQNLLLHGAGVLTSFLCMILIILALSGASSLRGWLSTVDQSIRLLVQADPRKAHEVKALLEQRSDVSEVTAMTHAEVADSISRVLGIAAPEALAELGLPPMLRVRPRSDQVVSPAVLADAITRIPGVESVEYGQRWLQRFQEAASTALRFGLLLTLFLGLAAWLILTTTYTLILYSRRRELEIMDMVGASMGHIYVPVMIEGLGQSLLGTLLALWVAGRVWRYAGEAVSVFGTPLQFHLSSGQTGFCLAVGLGLGMLASVSAMMHSIRALVEED